MQSDIDVAAIWSGVAKDLLRPESVHEERDGDRHDDRDGGAVRVPVPNTARQGAAIISPQMTVLCGIAGWADKSLIDSKLFYPMAVKTSADRLAFYASQFPLVEVDSTYYGIPKQETVEAWVAKTPAHFTFDVKSFSLFTNHPTRPLSMPPDLREGLPAALREKRNLYLEHVADDIVDETWDRFRAALEPLRAAGKLAAVLPCRRSQPARPVGMPRVEMIGSMAASGSCC